MQQTSTTPVPLQFITAIRPDHIRIRCYNMGLQGFGSLDDMLDAIQFDLPEPVYDRLREIDRTVATGSRQTERLCIRQPDRSEHWVRQHRAGAQRLAREAAALLVKQGYDIEWEAW